ncbi:enoyl-CoA hydratase [Streptomyces sp. TS71-3]|uniref:enoyl-CoA hydratase n=1 Tax=Streptomyces sp. TS71-3 TaxID=2733862 RepID=UPI001B2A1A36|nr:enoyl-CoA hydratase [Streptomyces sp. TS71-3]GHJ39338.1 enoyl-CoA hydratase [Streptomyces sp. TS71-3]
MSSDTRGDGVDLVVTDGIAEVRLRNPGRRNAFTWAMYDRLRSIAAEVGGRDDVAAVTIRGNPGDGFAAGTDIGQFTGFEDGRDGVAYERRIGSVVADLLAIDAPVVALVEGAAVGAGLVVAACCDLVIAERGARFGAPIARTLGNCLPAAIVARLRARVGAARTDAMLLGAALLPAESLAEAGFVTALAEPGRIEETAEPFLRRMRQAAPLTIRALKETGRRLDAAQVVPEDEDLLMRCYGSADFREGVSAFLAHRHPVWTGS